MADQSLPGASEEGPAASSEDTSFGSILSQFEQDHHLNGHDEAIEGRVVSITPDAVFVDIGRKMDGVIPAARFIDSQGGLTVSVGDKLLVNIIGRGEEGLYQLSTLRVERPRDWSAFEKAFAEARPVAATVLEPIKGGLRVDISGIRAFMPASRSGARDTPEMEKLIGQEVECRIIKLDTANEDVVVDRRVVLEQEQARAKQKVFSELHEGQVLRGTVRTVTDFGAFVDIGGVEGLLHVADMAWTRVATPSDVVKPGDEVDVRVLKINPETQKIALGIKQLSPDPWMQAAATFKIGDRVEGTVSRLMDFGAFVELMPGVDGLIHISEMSWSKKLRKPSDILNAGDRVQVVVLGVQPAEHRISLGLKQALGDPWEEAEKKYVRGTVVQGTVVSLASFGAFVDLGNGIEGMIHIGDISRERHLNHPREALSTGQSVRAEVLECDKAKRRIRLGMKQLEPTSADSWIAEHRAGDVVTGRVVDVRNTRARIELGEGVHGDCQHAPKKDDESQAAQKPAAADVSSLGAMLATRWKQGGGTPATSKPESLRAGQIRSFRITHLDPGAKRIELEAED